MIPGGSVPGGSVPGGSIPPDSGGIDPTIPQRRARPPRRAIGDALTEAGISFDVSAIKELETPKIKANSSLLQASREQPVNMQTAIALSPEQLSSHAKNYLQKLPKSEWPEKLQAYAQKNQVQLLDLKPCEDGSGDFTMSIGFGEGQAADVSRERIEGALIRKWADLDRTIPEKRSEIAPPTSQAAEPTSSARVLQQRVTTELKTSETQRGDRSEAAQKAHEECLYFMTHTQSATRSQEGKVGVYFLDIATEGKRKVMKFENESDKVMVADSLIEKMGIPTPKTVAVAKDEAISLASQNMLTQHFGAPSDAVETAISRGARGRVEYEIKSNPHYQQATSSHVLMMDRVRGVSWAQALPEERAAAMKSETFAKQIGKMLIFDYLGQNMDRLNAYGSNPGNIMIAKQGQNYSLALVDNEFNLKDINPNHLADLKELISNKEYRASVVAKLTGTQDEIFNKHVSDGIEEGAQQLLDLLSPEEKLKAIFPGAAPAELAKLSVAINLVRESLNEIRGRV